jgi:SAM-dependent methyltransferase
MIGRGVVARPSRGASEHSSGVEGDRARIRVIFVAGYARSGSTLLERLLGQVEGIESFGELRHIWYRSFQDNQLCSCGAPFHQCPFWNDVVDRAFGGFGGVDPVAVGRVKRSVDAFVQIPRILWGGRTPRFDRRMAAYRSHLWRLYAALHEVSGATFLVDATKDPQHALVLSGIEGVDVRMVHLVRDSRAVAFSWRRMRQRPEIHWETRDMPRYPALRTAIAWSLTNLAAEAAGRLMPYLRLRYEDLAADPRRELSRILRALEVPDDGLTFLSAGAAQMDPAHTVAGNPMRFQTGRVEIRPDTEWRRGLTRTDRAVVTALTGRLLERYGYMRRSPPRSGRGRRGANAGAGPRPREMWHMVGLAIAHRRQPLAYGRAAAGLCIRYLRSRRIPIEGQRILDVGTGSGTLPEALRDAGATAVGLDVEDRRAPGVARYPFVIGRGGRLPVKDGAFDLVLCSNVLEHVEDPWGLVDELLRACREDGLVYLSWTNWYSPFGGHEWSPFHYLGPRLGPRIYRTLRGRDPMNVPGRSLFAVHVGQMLRGLRERGLVVEDVAPRYWPSLRLLAKIPLVRETAMWNCVIMVRKPGGLAGDDVVGGSRSRRRRTRRRASVP